VNEVKTMKILIGYDGSACADSALDDLARAGLPDEVEAQVLSVTELWIPPPPLYVGEILEEARSATSPAQLQHDFLNRGPACQEAQALAESACDRLRKRFPNWKVNGEAKCGSIAWELITKADEWRPDLMVVGSHGRSAIGRLVLGSVSQRVVTEAKCSVRVARGRLEEPDTPVRIIVGIDGSAASREALEVVSGRNWAAGSEVKVIYVNSPLVPELWAKIVPQFGEINDEDLKEEQSWVAKISKHAIDSLRSAGVKVSSVLRQGDPKKVLPQAAEEWGADCIFLGSVGFSNRLERFVLGSVSAAVVARAHCSVEVVRPMDVAK
jgi:nucleotide-binding universal stress UspA family protein